MSSCGKAQSILAAAAFADELLDLIFRFSILVDRVIGRIRWLSMIFIETIDDLSFG